jgi:GTP diphosphokinase / guanosine-3',5'-bis(diphosphate) 3'-diphosphatase
MIRLGDILEELRSYNSNADLDLIRKAYVFSAKVHSGQERKSGEPYLIHPLETAFILAKMRLDEASVSTGLLHDTVEDSPLTSLEEIVEKFGEEIAELVDGVTKIGQMKFSSREQQQAENFKKILLATAKDIRVILVKLADRLHNMRTLEYVNPEKRERIARETMEIYAPLAHRLGIQWIKNELEDLAFRYLNSKAYYDIVLGLSRGRKERERFIDEVIQIIRDLLSDHSIEPEIYGRVKNIYSVWRKMQAQHLEFEQIPDILAFRVILDTVPECYEVMGIIHSVWKPVPGRFKDYIALPKGNMYQSLHTTVIGPFGERIEIQMRTREMHSVAEEGVAAHWRYKEGGKSDAKADQKIVWLRQMLDWQKEVEDSKEYIDLVKVDLFPDDVYVFTPAGEVLSFQKGATPIDFAYRVHTDVGHRCSGAKVNGQIVPLDYQLKSGDRIEIITSKDHVPSRDWLKIVRSGRAKAKIRAWLKSEQHEQSLLAGRSMAEKELRRLKLSLAKVEKAGALDKAATKLGFKTPDAMMAALGYGKLSKTLFIQEVIPKEMLDDDNLPKESVLDKILRPITRKERGGIKIRGIDNVLFRLAKCCSPVPGEKVVGFVTRGRGITVHATDCNEIAALDEERLVEVEWDLADKTSTQRTGLGVIVSDRPGMLADISQVIAALKVNISDVTTSKEKDGRIRLDFHLEIKNIGELKDVIKMVATVKGVLEVERVRSLVRVFSGKRTRKA